MKTHQMSKSFNFDKRKPEFLIDKHFPLIEIEKQIYHRFKSEYSILPKFYHTKIINEIISNERSHIVAEFKDYLINGDMSEFLQEYYYRKESKRNLPKIFEYYFSCSVIFPNYVILPESKYLYKNIQKKQKVIDNQQQLEQELEMKKEESISIYNEDSDKVFETKVFDSLLNQSNTSTIHQLLGVNSELDNIEGSINKSITNLIDTLTKVELNKQTFTDRYKRCSLKKESVNMKYANCTTTTKDKSNNAPQQTNKRKMIISNILSSDKDILMKAIKDVKNYKSARPLSNDNSNNASQFRDNRKRISSCSSNNTLIKSHKVSKGTTPNIINNLSMQKMSHIFQNPPRTSRESKNNTEIIQLLTSKLMRMKSSKKKTLISKFRNQQHPFKKAMSSLSNGTTSITQKITQVHYQSKDKIYDNLYDKYENSPKTKKSRANPVSNRNRNELAGNNKTNYTKCNNMLEHQFSLSPSRQNGNVARTCTHLPLSNSFTREKLKKASNAVIPRKDSLIKGIQIKGFGEFLKKNNSRNFSTISDRLSNKNKSTAHKMMN